MSDLGLYRALAGGAGLAGCIALLADQARAEVIEPVPPAPAAVTTRSAQVATDRHGTTAPRSSRGQGASGVMAGG